MFSLLRDRTFGRLFAAHAISLLGTGLVTISLALLAYELAGSEAGAVLGTALAIRIAAYIVGAPLGAVIAEHIPRKTFLVGLDLVRAGLVCLLPFVSAVWQIYALVAVLQLASACFTPAFQALIPEVVREESRYVRALSLSRLAADMETILSPLLAALLLLFVSFHTLFAGAVMGFVASATIVGSLALPPAGARVAGRRVLDAATRGLWIFIATPRLRGYLAMKMAVAAATAMVLVNSVVIVRGEFRLDENAVAFAMAFYGGGAVLGALALPTLLSRIRDRTLIAAAAAYLAGALALGTQVGTYEALMVLWCALGFGAALVNTPIGLLLTRSSAPADRTSLFSANFTLSHACWLLAYPLAGFSVSLLGLAGTFSLLGTLAALSCAFGLLLWPKQDPQEIVHDHPDLPDDHPHLNDVRSRHEPHRHLFHIDDLHPRWPANA